MCTSTEVAKCLIAVRRPDAQAGPIPFLAASSVKLPIRSNNHDDHDQFRVHSRFANTASGAELRELNPSPGNGLRTRFGKKLFDSMEPVHNSPHERSNVMDLANANEESHTVSPQKNLAFLIDHFWSVRDDHSTKFYYE